MAFDKSELTNATYGLSIFLTTILQLQIYSNISRKIFWFYIFLPSFSFLLSLFKLSCTKKHHVYSPYCILHTLSSCNVMYYIVSKICIGGRFLEDHFYCYSQQVISAVAIASLIPYNQSKKSQKHRTFNTVTSNANSNQIKKM